jgi:hypothetical protein
MKGLWRFFTLSMHSTLRYEQARSTHHCVHDRFRYNSNRGNVDEEPQVGSAGVASLVMVKIPLEPEVRPLASVACGRIEGLGIRVRI